MNSDEQTQRPTEIGAEAPNRISSSRRRLLRAGAGAAPVVLTVVSGPVRAGACFTASAFASTNAVMTAGTSANARAQVENCTGQKPSYWLNDALHNNYANWPASCKTNGADWLFPACLGVTTSSYKQADGTAATLRSALAETRTDTNERVMAKVMATVFLNMRKNLVPSRILTAEKLAAIWQQAPNGAYEPGGLGVRWDLIKTNEWMLRNNIYTAD